VTDRRYRCLGCLDATVARPFDVSHVSLTCPGCGAFERFLNETVLDQFRAFEAAPPDGLDWGRLDRREKLLVSERVARTGRSVEDFAVEE
jgi:hypothetical protein